MQLLTILQQVLKTSASSLHDLDMPYLKAEHAHICFRLQSHTCTEEAVVLGNIPAFVLPFLWKLHCHKLCSFLLLSLFLQGQPEGLLVSTSMVTQSVTLNLCCGQFSCSCFETLAGKVSGLSAPAFYWAPCPPSWRSALESLAFMVAEKSLKTQNLTIFLSVTHDFLTWRAHTIASFQLPFVSLHAAAPADVLGGVPALIHPKSSFCVCKSQHPLAQVSLFPTGGCRGSAWWGYMCIISCPFVQTSLSTSHFSKVAQLFPCAPSTEHFSK